MPSRLAYLLYSYIATLSRITGKRTIAITKKCTIKYVLNENANCVLQWMIALITHENVH